MEWKWKWKWSGVEGKLVNLVWIGSESKSGWCTKLHLTHLLHMHHLNHVKVDRLVTHVAPVGCGNALNGIDNSVAHCLGEVGFELGLEGGQGDAVEQLY